MKRNCIKLLIIFILLLVIVPSNVKGKEAKNILELKEFLEDLKRQKQEQANKKQETQSEINTKKNNIYNAYKEKEGIATEVEDAKNKIIESQNQIESASKDMDNILKYYQITSSNGKSFMDYIEDASTITDMIMRAKAVDQITTYYDNKINNLKKLITEKQNLTEELNTKNKQLDVSIDNYSNALSSLNNQMALINEVSLDIDTQIKAQENTLKYYQSICDSETQALSTCTKDPQSFGWLKPLNKGRITQAYGYVGGSYHNGIDIGGNPEGTLEYATAAGRVASIVYKSSCGGNIVYIHTTVNGQKYTLEYAHMLEIKVKLNQIVTTDTVIGTVGGYSTSKYYSGSYDGCAYGAHLHYGVAKGWYHVDYNTWSQFTAHRIQPPGFPNVGGWFYKR